MSDYNFLPFFLTEPIYVVRDSIVKKHPGSEIAELEKFETENEEPKIDSAKNIEVQPIIKKEVFKSRGGFKKNILLVVNDPFPEVLNITDSEFLIKILKAVKLNEEDVVIVNIHTLAQDFFPTIKEQFNYRVLILFGITLPSINGGSIENYKILNKEGTKVLSVDSLADIDGDKQKKLKLWENLQLLFIMK
ncbi:MAG: hypothetical protein M3512_07165 [Bacteroidota bacterium]|nr:hypothetical protein [Bacteroidota bacterium]